jgi:hypothetical protein
MSADEFLPAVAQGAIGIETRADNKGVRGHPRGHRSCRHIDGRCLRKIFPRSPRWLVQDSDRGSRDDCRRRRAISRIDRPAGRQRRALTLPAPGIARMQPSSAASPDANSSIAPDR